MKSAGKGVQELYFCEGWWRRERITASSVKEITHITSHFSQLTEQEHPLFTAGYALPLKILFLMYDP